MHDSILAFFAWKTSALNQLQTRDAKMLEKERLSKPFAGL